MKFCIEIEGKYVGGLLGGGGGKGYVAPPPSPLFLRLCVQANFNLTLNTFSVGGKWNSLGQMEFSGGKFVTC